MELTELYKRVICLDAIPALRVPGIVKQGTEDDAMGEKFNEVLREAK